MIESNDPWIVKAGAAFMGGLVSMKFLPGTWYEKAFMGSGGAVLSFYGSMPIASFFKAEHAVGLVGFLLGLFGMTLVAKGYEALQALDLGKVAGQAWAAFLKKFGG